MDLTPGQAVSTLEPHHDPELARLGFKDVQVNPRLAPLVAMVSELSLANTPRKVLDVFRTAMQRIYGQRALLTLSTLDLPPGDYRITRWFDQQGVNQVNTENPWEERHLLPVQRGGFLGRIIADGQPKLACHLHLHDDPVLGDRLAYCRSLIAAPAFKAGRPSHWALTLSPEPEGFDLLDLEEFVLRANMIGATVDHVAAAVQLRQVHEKIQQEVELIGQIQQALLPQQIPQIPGLSIAVSYQTFGQAGGDIYDIVPLAGGQGGAEGDDPRWAFMIGDVSGHGPAAAVMMAMLNSIVYAFPTQPAGPGELLEHANRHLCAKGLTGQFVTALMAFYHPRTRRLTYARAGHNPPLIKSAPPHPHAERLLKLDAVGELPLGILPEVRYHEASVQLEPNQTLVLYTDGIIEATDPQGNFFGVEGIESALIRCTGEPQCVLESIQQMLNRHTASHQPNDDQTLVAVRVDA